MAKDDLWNEIDALAKRASEHYGDNRVGYILTQVACIGRMFKRVGVKLLYDAIDLHCSSLLGEQFAIEVTKASKVKKNSGPKKTPVS